MGHNIIWENITKLNVHYLKSKIDQRLRDQYIQFYSSYVKDNLDSSKSEIVHLCSDGGEYSKRDYLETVTTPNVRSIIMKLRIDANKLNGCRFRHFRKKSDTSMCTQCGTQETVKHRLLECTKGDLVNLRETFENKCVSFFPDWMSKNPVVKLSIILNVNAFAVKDNEKGDMINIICTYIKKAYVFD